MMREFKVTGKTQRLDAFLVSVMKDLSRNKIQRLISDEKILINGKKKASSYKVKDGDKILVSIEEKALDNYLRPWNFPLEIIYECDDFVVIDKPFGVSVHPANGSDDKTIANALLYHFGDGLSSVAGAMKPGIVHRLDKYTSGCLLVAKNDKAHAYFSAQFKDRKVKKLYLTLVKGELIPKTGTIDSPIGRSYRDRKKMSVHSFHGRSAVTHYEVLKYVYGCSLLKVRIETGRTHQIRAHLAAIGHPVVCDDTYGDKKFNNDFREKYGLSRQFLHAQKIGFNDLSGEWREFEALIPSDLQIF